MSVLWGSRELREDELAARCAASAHGEGLPVRI